MQIPQVTASPSAAEPKVVEGDEPSANGTGGEKGAFAILLALLQSNGAVQAAPGSGDTVAEDADATGSANLSGGGKNGSASSTSNLPLIAGDANVTASTLPAPAAEAKGPDVGASKQETESVSAKEQSSQTPVTGKADATAKPLVVTEIAIPVAAEKPAEISTARYMVPATDSADAEVVESQTPTARAAPASAPVAESETGIPIAKVVSAADTEAKAETKSAAPEKIGIEPVERSEASRSAARFLVAKAGVANSEAPASTVTTEQSAVDSELDAVPKTLDGDQTAAHKESARMPLRNAGTPALQADGTRPMSAEVPQSAPVAIDRTVPSNGAEVVRAEVDQASPPERTTVKTIAIDTVKGVRYLLTKGEQTMRIRLVPESLGELRLVVTSSGDEITVRLASANHGVRELLHTQVQHLREVLAQDGTPVGKITITGDMSAGTGNGNLLSGSPDRGLTPHARGWTGNMAGSPNQTPTNGQQPVAVPGRSVTHAGTLNLFA